MGGTCEHDWCLSVSLEGQLAGSGMSLELTATWRKGATEPSKIATRQVVHLQSHVRLCMLGDSKNWSEWSFQELRTLGFVACVICYYGQSISSLVSGLQWKSGRKTWLSWRQRYKITDYRLLFKSFSVLVVIILLFFFSNFIPNVELELGGWKSLTSSTIVLACCIRLVYTLLCFTSRLDSFCLPLIAILSSAAFFSRRTGRDTHPCTKWNVHGTLIFFAAVFVLVWKWTSKFIHAIIDFIGYHYKKDIYDQSHSSVSYNDITMQYCSWEHTITDTHIMYHRLQDLIHCSCIRAQNEVDCHRQCSLSLSKLHW